MRFQREGIGSISITRLTGIDMRNTHLNLPFEFEFFGPQLSNYSVELEIVSNIAWCPRAGASAGRCAIYSQLLALYS